MNKKDKLEGEEIQKGLEEFLNQELYGVTQEPYRELDLSLAPKDGLEKSSMAETEVTHKSDELDISLARPIKKSQRNRDTAGKNIQENRERKEREPVKMQSVEKGGRKDMSGKKKTKSKKNKHNKQEQKSGAQKNKKGRGIRILAAVAAVFLLCVIGLYLVVGSVYKKMNYAQAEDYTNESMKEDGVINVLLIGNDSRLAGDDGRSDAMILVSISDKTKTITMTSLLRDMYVDIPGHDGNRLNAAYSYGGAQLLMQTIEHNFDIPVHRYALVNFQAFANLVDAVGGVDLELTNDEVQYVNGYLMEYNQLEGKDLATDFLDPASSGELHLNGPQALAYTRNRYIGTDFGRTERQRKVLSAVIARLPQAVLKNGGELADGLFPNLTTNLKQTECYSLSLNAWKFVGYKMVQQCVPAEGTYSNESIRGMDVLKVDFDANRQFLKAALYGE